MSIDELTEKVLGACFEVSNVLGIGFLESVYEKSLLIALLNRGLKAESQSPIKVFYQKQNVGEFFADIVVEDELIIEIKAVKALAPEHIAQLLNYLKATEKKRGLLVNFGRSKLEFRRFDNRLVKVEGNC